MKISFKYIFLVTVLSILFLELGLRYVSPISKKRDTYLNSKHPYKIYSIKEMDKKLPIRLEYHGGTCVKKGLAKDRMNWHPRFGYHDKKVNIECINNLFTKKTKNIVFFGGSVMNNMETPNYLTSIEYYAFKDYMNQFRSINFTLKKVMNY